MVNILQLVTEQESPKHHHTQVEAAEAVTRAKLRHAVDGDTNEYGN